MDNLPSAVSRRLTVVVPRIAISEPKPGQALQGTVRIIGSSNIRNFAHAEIAFAYQDNPTDTWFIISESDQGVVNDVLAVWDTTTITDNIYQLRLLVTTEDNRQFTEIVDGLRIRNYTAIETDTPQPDKSQIVNPTMIATSTATPLPKTPTPLPTNPANIQENDLIRSGLNGIVIVILSFTFGFLFFRLRKGSS